MRGGLGPVGEQPGAFEHHVDFFRSPRQFCRIANRADGNAVAVDGQAFLIVLHIGVERAVNGVVFEQMSVDRTVAQVIDGNDLQVLAITLGIQCAQDVAADTAKTIYCNSKSHLTGPPSFCCWNYKIIRIKIENKPF